MEIKDEEYLALRRVRELARKVCEHHEADKVRQTNPDYIEVQLLNAVEEAEKYDPTRG